MTFTNKTSLQLTLGVQPDCDVIVCKGARTYAHTHARTQVLHCTLCLVDALAHASERETIFSTIIQTGRVGIMTSPTLLMDDIGLLHPTILSTTPRYYQCGIVCSIVVACTYLDSGVHNWL